MNILQKIIDKYKYKFSSTKNMYDEAIPLCEKVFGNQAKCARILYHRLKFILKEERTKRHGNC